MNPSLKRRLLTWPPLHVRADGRRLSGSLDRFSSSPRRDSGRTRSYYGTATNTTRRRGQRQPSSQRRRMGHAASKVLGRAKRTPTKATPAPPTTAAMTDFGDGIVVIYVLGGPGAGKGTQCAQLVKDFGFSHLSAGDLLRDEQHREGSEFSQLIQDCIKNGQIVPMQVTIKLLENAMKAAIEKKGVEGVEGWESGRGRFLIDGFPRKMDQALEFDRTVREATAVLFFSTTEEVMLKRLLERGKTSGREDDNEESIKKRFKTYLDTTMPVIDYYREKGKVAEVDSSASVEEVHAKASQVVNQIFRGEMSDNIKLD